MITPLFKTIITSTLKKADTEHRVNRRYKPNIIRNNDFTSKKYLSKSYDAQLHRLKTNSRKFKSLNRQTTDFRSTGNFWRLTQRRLLHRTSSRVNSSQSTRRPSSGEKLQEQNDCSGIDNVKQFSSPPSPLVGDHGVPTPIQNTQSVQTEASSSLQVKNETALLYSDDFHTVSDIKPFSVNYAPVIYCFTPISNLRLL